MGRVSLDYKPWVSKAEPSDLFPFAYDLKCIKSIIELKQALSYETDYMSFDTETTGLNQEEIDIVGYSFCLDGKTAYYVPVWHFNFGLGEEALDLIYEKMCNTKVVAMFNMRYDVRVMEYHGYTSLYKEILEKDYTSELESLKQLYLSKSKECPYKDVEELREYKKLELSNKPYIKYDMAKVYTYDVQAVVFLVDTGVKYPSLKASEDWYLGWRGASFEETVKNAQNENAVTMKKDLKTGQQVIKDLNFFYLTPEEAYEYAAIDALGTYLLGVKLKPYYKEAKTSGKLDIECLQPLVRFENELTLIDTDRLKNYSIKLGKRISSIQKRCWETAGTEFNLGSNKETNTVLKSLNIHTGVTTKNGNMSTSKESIKACLDRLPPGDNARQFLQDLTDYGACVKQKSSYIDNIIEMAESNKHHKNRLRFSYKTTEVPSGRLAAGGDKKNKFFAGANIQNITKPHVTTHYCLSEDIVKQYYPDIIEAINKSGTREEAETDLQYLDNNKILDLCKQSNFDYNNLNISGKRWSYRIFGWVFSDKPWLIPNVQEYTVEGFIQEQNIRSCFLPDDGYYWVSLDFNAEEIRIPALWSGEPAWVNAFKEGKDVHKACYSLDTEFLTPDGFKTYDKIDSEDLMGQYDEDLKKVTWVKAGHKFFNESDTMYHFVGNNTDLLVTPNHRMYTKGRDNWYIVRADKAYTKRYLSTICSPDIQTIDSNIEKIIIPASTKREQLVIDINNFAELMGYILTDGGTCLKSQGQKVVYIGQSEAKPEVLLKIQDLNKRLGNIFNDSIDTNMEQTSIINGKEIKKTKSFHRFSMGNSSLYDYIIDNFGGPLKPGRYLPNWFKNLPKEQLQIFLDAYILGDGTIDLRQGRKVKTIYIANKQMLDDIQYICLRLGYATNYSKTQDGIYRINITPNKREVKVSNSKSEIIKYDNPVKSVCFAVPTGLLVVRRNGKVSVCGNTAVTIWGEENYSKDKRKKAKGANFGENNFSRLSKVS